MYKLTVFIPKENKEEVKNAMFAAGGGRIGNYDSCCFELEGKGEFRPLDGSNPHLGNQNQIETVDEVRVEMVISDELVRPVLKAMRETHPYEEVAFDLIELANHKFT